MATLYSFQKPYKVWSCDRQIRKSVVASSLLELKLRGAEKLGYDTDNVSDLKVVLEADGTEVEEDSYFQTAEKDTIFILLRQGEIWLPLGVEALKTALSAIPGLVSDALNKLEQSDRLPNWKVADRDGLITVVLQWDTREREGIAAGSPLPETADIEMDGLGISPEPAPAGEGPITQPRRTSRETSPSILKRTTTPTAPSAQAPTPPILKVSPSRKAKMRLEGLPTAPPTAHTIPQRVPIMLPDTIHYQITAHPVVPELIGMGGLEYGDSSEEEEEPEHPEHEHSATCDFHCAAVHRVQLIKKSVATSPITEMPGGLFAPMRVPRGPPPSAPRGKPPPLTGKPPPPTGKYVRFQDLEPSKSTGSEDSDTTETEDTTDNLVERYLLLTDQLAIGQDRHLTIKDIGVILERLNFKIVDVDKLEREPIESPDCHNWLIRAVVRGDQPLREIGVVYNSVYYGITEHPGYF